MSDRDYYPAGAYEDPRAIYNLPPDPEPREFDVIVTYTMSKSTSVWSDQYIETSDVDYDTDDDTGRTIRIPWTDYDTSECDFEKDFADQHYSPLILLKEYQGILIKQINEIKEKAKTFPRDKELKNKIKELEMKIADCEDWEFDEIEVEKQ